jgi:tetratricopeptide (TPR) repeat protein
MSILGHRFQSTILGTGLVGLALVSQLEAQGARLAPKLSLAAGAATGCAAFATPVMPTAPSPLGEDPEVRRLIELGNEAALQGEHQAARDAFQRAAQLAPANARLAYYLGRQHEELQEFSAAVREYCRYLALAASAPDADEVRGRIVRLVPASELARMDELRGTFRSAVALLQRRQYGAADSLFSSIAQQLPAAPEVYFNRALARAARGLRGAALEDFEKYLELAPLAPDRTQVRSATSRLQDRVYSPGSAFGSGLAVPGMGQMSTGRPLLGVLLLGAVASTLSYGLTQERTVHAAAFTDPFGNRYVDSLPATTRPRLLPGVTAAAVLWLGSAWEAAAYARRTRARAEAIIAGGTETGLGWTLSADGYEIRAGLSLTLPGGRHTPDSSPGNTGPPKR